MRPGYRRLVFSLFDWMTHEHGQDLVEYALILALLAAFVTASTRSMALVLTTALSNIAVMLGT
jgi:Flp pilus assembly pilin Flp